VLYKRVYYQLRGILVLNIQGGHNKKLNIPQKHTLKDYILFCYYIKRNASISNIIKYLNQLLAFNSIINKNKDLATILH